MEVQNYKNHGRTLPLFHFIMFLLMPAVIIGAFINLYKIYKAGEGEGLYSASLICVLSIVLLLTIFFTRQFALKAQDRAIRAEENIRYFAITGSLLDSRLTLRQIIALRFAPNNELLDLAHRAVEENLKPSEIKKAIKSWKGDYERV